MPTAPRGIRGAKAITAETDSRSIHAWLPDWAYETDPHRTIVLDLAEKWVEVSGVQFRPRGRDYSALRFAVVEEGLTPEEVLWGLDAMLADPWWRKVPMVPSTFWPANAARWRAVLSGSQGQQWPEGEDREF